MSGSLSTELMLSEKHRTELKRTSILQTQIKLIRCSLRQQCHFDKRKNIGFVFFHHSCKYADFYQTNKILYP